MSGTLKSKPRAMQASGPVGASFEVVLASVDPGVDGYAFDVQRRRNGKAWSAPKRVEGATYSFTAKKAGRYDVRARLIESGSGGAGPVVAERTDARRLSRRRCLVLVEEEPSRLTS